MKRLEIVSLRTSGTFEQKARKYMKDLCKMIEKSSETSAGFYIHEFNPGDFAIIIMSQTRKGQVIRTELGTCMEEALKQFGLVDYNCWVAFDGK